MDKTARAYWIGKRVQIPAFTDNWLRGDRYGHVVRCGELAGRVIVKVEGDKGTITRVWADDCDVVQS